MQTLSSSVGTEGLRGRVAEGCAVLMWQHSASGLHWKDLSVEGHMEVSLDTVGESRGKGRLSHPRMSQRTLSSCFSRQESKLCLH